MTKALDLLREHLKEHNLHGILVPHNDCYFGEYLVERDERIAFLTNFTGSAGFLIVTADQAVLFVDGRYTLQATHQVDQQKITLRKLGEESIWFKHYEKHDQAFAYDPSCFSENSLRPFKTQSSQFVPKSVVDEIWENRPKHPEKSLFLHPIEFSGKEAKEKIHEIKEVMQEKNIEATVLSPESWSWMVNVRGSDLFYTPISQGFCFVTQSKIILFLHTTQQQPDVIAYLNELGVEIASISHITKTLESYATLRFGYDSQTTPLSIKEIFEVTIPMVDPCALPRATKNTTEIAGAISAHKKDAHAWMRFRSRLEDKYKKGEPITEMDIDQMLLEERQKEAGFVSPSFATIAGSGPNGAIVHYRADEKSNRMILKDEILLIDSGAQYKDGTTDITRTIILGKPTPEMKRDFTRVLKGHIGIASAKFPKGTSGGQLDTLARIHLWKDHKDFAHGTGHGVGSFLSVHEGPQRISKFGHQPLLPGMILSNEPGYYLEGQYGIRIESLVCVKEDRENWYAFETLTLVPIDEKLIDWDLLDKEEKCWVESYQKNARTITP